jgi:hypothetical protein
MAPGANATILPLGRAKRLPAGAWLKFQIHYTPNGTPASDQTKMAFQFDDAPPTHEVQTSAIVNTRIRIPPGATDHRISASVLFDQPTLVLGLTPHMHLRGKAFRYDLEYPDGRRRVICDVPRFQFDWQFGYMLAEPLEVPAGARLHAVGWYDNSAENPANPDPTRTVKWGQQVWDEMFIGYFDWTR